MTAVTERVRNPSASRWSAVGLPDTGGLRRAPETYFVVVLWILIVVGQVTLSISRDKAYAPITDGPRQVAGWAAAIGHATDALVLVVCGAAVVAGWRRARWTTGSVAILGVLLLPWVVLVARALELHRPLGVAVLAYPAFVAALWVLRPRMGVIEVLGYLTAVGSALAMAMALAVPNAGIYTGGTGFEEEKPIGPLGILAGYAPTGNNFARYIVVGLPAVLAIRRPLHRWVATAITLAALAWTASRTAWFATAVVIVALVVLRALRARRADDAAPRAAIAGLVALTLVGAVLPFIVHDGAQFNHRAKIWMFVLERWRETPVFGRGADYFTVLATEPVNLGGYAYHAHNGLVQLLITGGVVLAVCTVALMVVAAVRGLRQLRAGYEWAVLFLACILAMAVFEPPLSFADKVTDNAPTLVPLLVLLCARAGRPAQRRDVDREPVELEAA